MYRLVVLLALLLLPIGAKAQVCGALTPANCPVTLTPGYYALGIASTLSVAGATTLSGGGTLNGTFTGAPTFSGTPTFAGAVTLSGGGTLSGVFTGTGNVGTLTATGNSVTNSLATWMGYLNGIKNPNSVYFGTGTTSGSTPIQMTTTTDTSWTVFGTLGELVATHSAQSAIVGYALNDASPGTNALPGGVNGWGKVTGTGNQAFGMYGLGTLNATAGTAIGGEFTSRNFCGAPDTNLPPNESIGTSSCVGNGLQVTAGGTYNNSLGMVIGAEAGSSVYFNTDAYLHQWVQYGLFIDVQQTGNGTSEVIQNTGAGTNLQLGTTGTISNNNSVISVLDKNSTGRFSVRQIGDTYGRAWISNGVAAPGSLSPCSGTGSGGTCTFTTGSNDGVGTIIITAGSTAGSSGSIGLNFLNGTGPNSSVCVMTLVNGTGSWAAASTVLISSQSTTASGIAWTNGGATSLTNGSTYAINYWCPGR